MINLLSKKERINTLGFLLYLGEPIDPKIIKNDTRWWITGFEVGDMPLHGAEQCITDDQALTMAIKNLTEMYRDQKI